jgi:putative membrane protein
MLSKDQQEAYAQLAVIEKTLIEGLKWQATREIEAATRRVATVTTLVQLALANVTAVLYRNVKILHRIAHIYGGRGELLGSW